MGRRAHGRGLSRILLYAALSLIIMTFGWLGSPLPGLSVAEAQGTSATTWQVMVGNGSPHMRVDGMQYYPGVITIDAGDTIVWTLGGAEPHTVTFLSGATPPAPGSPASEAPMGGSVYSGTGVFSSGLLLPIPGHNQYHLTFTTPGVYSYRCLLHPNQQGVVIVNPAGTPYPATASQYAAEGQAEWQATLTAANTAQTAVHPMVTYAANGVATLHAFMDAAEPADVQVSLGAVSNSGAGGTATLTPQGPSSIATALSLTGLAPGSAYAVEIRAGSCQAVGPVVFTLPSVTANGQGTAQSDGTLSPVDGLASAGWIVAVLAQGSTTASSPPVLTACGTVSMPVYALMRYEPSPAVVHAGDAVQWTQLDSQEIHTVTFLAAGQAAPSFPSPQAANPAGGTVYDGSGFFSSGILGPYQSYQLTFAKPGIFPYLCTLHDEMGMTAVVEVRPAQVPLANAVFLLTHKPVGWYGIPDISLQLAADDLWTHASGPSLFVLSHHPVGALGASLDGLQRSAALLWLNGIPRA